MPKLHLKKKMMNGQEVISGVLVPIEVENHEQIPFAVEITGNSKFNGLKIPIHSTKPNVVLSLNSHVQGSLNIIRTPFDGDQIMVTGLDILPVTEEYLSRLQASQQDRGQTQLFEAVSSQSQAWSEQIQDESLPGGGGAKHRVIQNFLKSIGEEIGYVSLIEASVDGVGRQIDVLLTRDGVSVACEVVISNVSGAPSQMSDYLSSGRFNYVVCVSDDRSKLQLVARKTQEDSRSRFLLPEEFKDFLVSVTNLSEKQEELATLPILESFTAPTVEEEARRMKVVMAQASRVKVENALSRLCYQKMLSWGFRQVEDDVYADGFLKIACIPLPQDAGQPKAELVQHIEQLKNRTDLSLVMLVTNEQRVMTMYQRGIQGEDSSSILFPEDMFSAVLAVLAGDESFTSRSRRIKGWLVTVRYGLSSLLNMERLGRRQAGGEPLSEQEEIQFLRRARIVRWRL